MSALEGSRAHSALNLKPAPRPPAVSAAPTKNPGQEESSKATFSKLLAHSRAAAAQQPPAATPRAAPNPASPARTARHATSNAKGHADSAPEPADSRASDARIGPSTATRSSGADPAATKASADAEATEASPATADGTDGEARSARAEGAVSDLASLLAGALPPVAATPLPAPAPGTATGDAAADPTRPVAGTLTPLGQAAAGPAGNEAAASAAAGFASTTAATPTGQDGFVQATTPVDPKAVLDTTAASGALPNAWLPEAALAPLAALATGVGQAEEVPKTSAALDALPLGANAAIGAHGVAALARSIDSAASTTATVATAVGDPGFDEALAAQVSVFARGGLSKAELHLNPADLGPVSVQITMNGDQARVDFGADRAQTRQAIEAGWAELASSLKDAGFTLSGGGVSEQAGRQASEREAVRPSGRAQRSDDTDDTPVASIVAARPRAGSALDTYA